MSKFKPNFTQIPNEILDNLLDELSGAEFKILMYICRRTYGFHKESDEIAYSQIASGVGKKDRGTGLSRETISVATKSLEERGILIVDRTGGTNNYEINLKHKVVRKSDQLEDAASQKTRPEVVRKSDIQKKGNKDGTKVPGEGLSINELLPVFKPLNPTGYTLWFKNKTERNAVASLAGMFSKEDIEGKIKVILKHRNDDQPYQFPSINSPYDLATKHEKIKSWIIAYKKM
jgi:phage replication O-like protein O